MKPNPDHPRAARGLLLLLAALLLLLAATAPSALAGVTPVSFWRMGDFDPGAAPATIATTTIDHAGSRAMALVNAPLYDSAVSTEAATRTGSASCIQFATGDYGISALPTTVTDNFGIELWVKPADTTGDKCLAYNGHTGTSGWGIYQQGATYKGLFGGLVGIGSGAAVAGQWTHLALVRDNGTTTFYVDGVAAGTTATTPTPPAGNFGVAAKPQDPASDNFAGSLDDLRVFTFTAGAFSPSDLLRSTPLVSLECEADDSSIDWTDSGTRRVYDPGGNYWRCNMFSDILSTSAQPADLSSTFLAGSNIGSANLTGANLNGANLSGTNLSGTNLFLTDLTNANLTGADLSRVRSGGIVGTPASLPGNWRLAQGFLIGPGANLSGADLTGAYLAGANFTGADLTGADLSGADLTGATFTATDLINTNLTGANLTNANLSGPGLFDVTDLTGADLTGANLTGANLTRTDLIDTDLTNANLTGVNLNHVRSGGIIGTPAFLPGDWQLVQGFLIGPLANLAHVDLTGANLTGADLTGADLFLTDLTNANLSGVRSGGTHGPPAFLPGDWQFVQGFLVGPGANLSGADLPGANLAGADLTGADLTGANLSGADLTGVTFTGADLTGATLTGAFSVVDTVADELDVPVGLDHSLREAIRDVPPGVIIRFDGALASQIIRLGGTHLLIDKDLTIDASALPDGLTLSGENLSRVLEVAAGPTVNLHKLTITGGNSPSGGGGILNAGTLILTECAVVGNSAAFSGGGIRNNTASGNLTIIDGTVSGNTATGFGGGLTSSGGSIPDLANGTELRNVTISGNQLVPNVSGQAFGAGIHHQLSFLKLINVTVSDNSVNDPGPASGGGGIMRTSGDLHIENSIVSGNLTNTAPAVDVLGSVTTRAGVNFIGDPTGASGLGTLGTDYLTGDAQLAPLGDYGGLMQTMPPLPGSPAIEGAVMLAETPATDQRGAARPSGPLPDIGAVEAFPFSSLTLVDTDSDGIDDRIEPAYPQFSVGVDDSALDTDGDRFTDAQEIANMTDLFDITDYFRITSMTPAAGFDPVTNPVVEITWTTFPGLLYSLECDSGLDFRTCASTGRGTWNATGSLAEARRGHAAALLPDGSVLVVGGTPAGDSVERYDPVSETWSGSSSLSVERPEGPTATRLSDGRVLVVGGEGLGANSIFKGELFDPVGGTWNDAGEFDPIEPLTGHAATLLSSGEVLVTGGAGSFGGIAERYDPVGDSWSGTGSLITGRASHTATRLPNGNVLVAGGYAGGGLASAEVYDPATGNWNSTGPLGTARWYHTAALLPDGKVLVAGGRSSSGTLASAELYDPVAGTWSPTGSLGTGRFYHTATLLPSGEVLVAGGNATSSVRLASVEIYNPGSGTWGALDPLGTPRGYTHTATLLSDGRVLVAGGNDAGANLDSVEIFEPPGTVLGPVSADDFTHGVTIQLQPGRDFVRVRRE